MRTLITIACSNCENILLFVRASRNLDAISTACIPVNRG